MNKSLICYGVMGGVGLVLIIVSMAGFAYFPPLIEDQVFKTLDLTDEDSEGYSNFVSIESNNESLKSNANLI